jgi:hypothetical protein
LNQLTEEKIVTAEVAQLERIVQSAPFRTSEIHRALLTYLVQKSVSGEADSLKEYTVGLEVFHKPPSYDPRQESTVRMHTARLRQKLGEYYQTEGAADPIVISLPKGAFKIVISYRQEPQPVEVPLAEQPAISRPWGWAAAGIAAILCGGLFAARFWSPSSAQAKGAPAQSSEIERLWAPFLASDRPLILSLAANPAAADLTAPGTAEGAFLLGQFFATHKRDVSLEKSSQLSVLELGMDNVVFVGTAAGNRIVQKVLANLDFVLDPKGVRNLKPKAGEPAIISDPPVDVAGMEEGYALITHLPALKGDGDALYLSGNQIGSVVGAVRTFTDPAWAKVLASSLQSGTGSVPRFYQAVIKVRSMEGIPIEASYVMHRVIESRISRQD